MSDATPAPTPPATPAAPATPASARSGVLASLTDPAHPAFDRYTVGMAAAGALMGLNGFPIWLAAALGVAFRFSTSKAGSFVPGSFAHPANDHSSHDWVDLGALLLAWYAMRRLPTDGVTGLQPGESPVPELEPPGTAPAGSVAIGTYAWPG